MMAIRQNRIRSVARKERNSSLRIDQRLVRVGKSVI